MNIYLIRHGMTSANELHLYCGKTDLPLSAAGREALQKLQYKIPENAFFLSSGMIRCNETLRLLFGNVEYGIYPDFREIDFGVFEMKSYEQLKNDPQYQAWLSGNNEENVPPEGESGIQMKKRVLHAFEQLRNSKKDIVLVSHGGVIATIMEALFPEEQKNRYQWQPKPGCGYLIENNRFISIP